MVSIIPGAPALTSVNASSRDVTHSRDGARGVTPVFELRQTAQTRHNGPRALSSLLQSLLLPSLLLSFLLANLHNRHVKH